MLGWLVNRPYGIIEQQKRIQADHRPIYFRYPRARLYVGAYVAAWSLGMLGTGYGIVSLIKGKSAT